MIRLASDQNFNWHILVGLKRRLPDLDLLRVQDVGLSSALDPAILEWTAAEERILLTHDRRTIPAFAYDRVTAGESMPGIFVVSSKLPVGQAIDELHLAITCLSEAECMDSVQFFPL